MNSGSLRLATVLRDVDDYTIDIVLRYSGWADRLERLDSAREHGYLQVQRDVQNRDTGKLALYRKFLAALALTGEAPVDVRRDTPPMLTARGTPAVILSSASTSAHSLEHFLLIQQMGRATRSSDIRLLFGQGTVLGDLWADSRHLYVNMLLILRSVVALLCVAVRRPAFTRPYALVMLAVCRRYGRRSEPHDHAPLLIHQQLLSTGSCAPI